MPTLHDIGLWFAGLFALGGSLFAGGPGTIEQLSPFQVSGGQVRLASTTADFRVPSLASENCIGTDSNGVFGAGTCSGGAGAAFPFTPASWGNSTSTVLGFTQGVISNASSTFTATTTFSAANFNVTRPDVSASESVGGVLNINRSTSLGPAFVAYTNAGTGAGRLVSLVADNTAYDTQALHVRSDSTLESTVNVLGSPEGKGIVKIGSNGVGDANSSGLSIDTSLSSFIGAGVFLKGNSTGKLLNLRNQDSAEVLTLLPSGRLGLNSTAPTAALQIGSVFMVATTTASTTIVGTLTTPNFTSALLLTDAGGAVGEYTGIDCTNQFVRDVSAAGAGTCASVSLTADVTGDLAFSSLAQVAANSVLANPTAATADAQSVATSTLFGANVTPGYVLTASNGAWVAAATSTCEQITGSSALCDGDDATGAGGGDFPFTPYADGNSTSTLIRFTQGILSTASSTFTGNATTTGMHAFANVRIPSITHSFLTTNVNGLVVSTTSPITSLDGLTAPVQTFSSSNDTNMNITWSTSGGTNHVTTLAWQSTLSTARGGLGGDFSALSGWLHDAAGTVTASTSPTVNWLYATSTTATSTFKGAVRIDNGSGDNALSLSASRIYPASNSVGGMALFSNSTVNSGPAAVFYTNFAGTSLGNLVNFRCDNTAMAHDCVKIDHDGAGDGLAIAATASASNALSLSNTGVDHTLNTAYTGSTAQKGALNVTSTNTTGSAFQITGRPDALGVGKITHDSTGDADSSILSLSASNTGYLGQGIFADMETVSGGQKVLNIRTDGNERFTVNGFGIASTTYLWAAIASSTDLTVTSVLNIPNGTGPTVNAAGEIALDTTTNNLILATSTNAGGFVVGSATTSLYSFSVASTSPDLKSGGIIDMPAHFLPQVITGVICHVDAGTSVVINLDDGTNNTNSVTCTATRTQYALTSNFTWTANEAIRLEVGTVTGSVDYLVMRFIGYRISD